MKAGKRALSILLILTMAVSLCVQPALGAWVEDLDIQDGALTGTVRVYPGDGEMEPETLSQDARTFAAVYDAESGQFQRVDIQSIQADGQFSLQYRDRLRFRRKNGKQNKVFSERMDK